VRMSMPVCRQIAPEAVHRRRTVPSHSFHGLPNPRQ
jgi:hypothetical protein